MKPRHPTGIEVDLAAEMLRRSEVILDLASKRTLSLATYRLHFSFEADLALAIQAVDRVERFARVELTAQIGEPVQQVRVPAGEEALRMVASMERAVELAAVESEEAHNEEALLLLALLFAAAAARSEANARRERSKAQEVAAHKLEAKVKAKEVKRKKAFAASLGKAAVKASKRMINAAKRLVREMRAKTVKALQLRAGITHYRWRTILDGREREAHHDIDGEIFSWAEGHPTEGNPGDPIMCRCGADPIAPTLAASPFEEAAGSVLVPMARLILPSA